jgi:hypothetical protein
MKQMVTFVGGPVHGKEIEYTDAHAVHIPVRQPEGVGTFTYTMRKCKDANGNVVAVLAPAGKDIDKAWLKANGLKN